MAHLLRSRPVAVVDDLIFLILHVHGGPIWIPKKCALERRTCGPMTSVALEVPVSRVFPVCER